MFFKLSTLAILLPFVNALSINAPTNASSGGSLHITWTTSAGDPSTWSFELSNPDNFHNTFAIANNVDPSTGSLDLTLGIVPPGSGYTIQAVNITNVNQVFAQSSFFDIAPTVSSTSSSQSSTSSGSSSTSGSSSGSVTSSGASSSSTSFGVTVSSTGSSGSTSSTGTSSSSASSPSTSQFNGNGNGAASMDVSSWFAMVAAVIAGAAAV